MMGAAGGTMRHPKHLTEVFYSEVFYKGKAVL
jgi:hypothetical protein